MSRNTIAYAGVGLLLVGFSGLLFLTLSNLKDEKKNATTIQRITCVYGNYFTFTADAIYFQRFTGESVEFKDIEGNVVSYKMREGEYCGWQPAADPNAAVMNANPEQGVPSE